MPAERTNQRRRTRTDLLRAARELVAMGQQPSVAAVADAAGISRATAYRYFSRPEDIVREAVLDTASEAVRPTRPNGVAGVASGLDQLVGQVFRLLIDNEAMFRAFLAHSSLAHSSLTHSSLGGSTEGDEEAGPRRGGRRLGWLGTVLDPLRTVLPEADVERLRHALALVTGAEALVVLRDVCELDPDGTEAVLRWSAQALLQAALRDQPAPDREPLPPHAGGVPALRR